MNIFVITEEPKTCAIALDDKRVRHMPKECFEMLSMAYHIMTGRAIAPFIIWNRKERAEPKRLFDLYNHKCTRWVASSRNNMTWLYNYVTELLKEYEYRFGHTHYLYPMFLEIHHHIPFFYKVPSKFVDASGMIGSNVFDNYKKSLVYKWTVVDSIMPIIWTNRDKPIWFDKYEKILKEESFIQGNLFNRSQLDIFEEDDLPF